MISVHSLVDGLARGGAATFQQVSPVDGSVVTEATGADSTTVSAAVGAASQAYRRDRFTTADQRRARCYAVADQLVLARDAIARQVTLETGRPYLGAQAEVVKAAEGMRLAGEEAMRLEGRTIPVAAPGKIVMTRWYPTGVWAVLSPWNFPVNIPVEYLGPVLATGNAAVWKPAPSTAGSAWLVMQAIRAADVPDGLVNLLVTEDLAVAEDLLRAPEVIGVGLTGSTASGVAVSRAAVGKRTLLELGGNGPVIVFADADLDAAAVAIAASCFSASGQVCSAGGRILAHRSVAVPLAEAVSAIACASYRCGDPFDPVTQVGPLHSAGAAAHLENQLHAATQSGARIHHGGKRLPGPTEQYLPATVISAVPVDSELNTAETFGPVAPIVALDADDVLLAEANRGDHALSTAVFTRDIGRALWAADRLNFGSIVVNDRSTYWELHLPFGGWEGSGSGTGRVGVAEVVRTMCQQQTLSLTAPPRSDTGDRVEPTP